MNLNTVPKMGPPGGPIFGTACTAKKRTEEKHFHGGPIFGTVWRYQKWDRKIAKSTAKADPCNKQKWQLRLVRNKHIELEQRRPAHTKPDFNWLSGPRNGTWQRTCGISCLRSLAPMRRLQCSTTQATFTNPSLLRATPLLRGMF